MDNWRDALPTHDRLGRAIRWFEDPKDEEGHVHKYGRIPSVGSGHQDPLLSLKGNCFYQEPAFRYNVAIQDKKHAEALDLAFEMRKRDAKKRLAHMLEQGFPGCEFDSVTDLGPLDYPMERNGRYGMVTFFYGVINAFGASAPAVP